MTETFDWTALVASRRPPKPVSRIIISILALGFDLPLTLLLSPRTEGRGEGEGSGPLSGKSCLSKFLGRVAASEKYLSASAAVISKNVGCGSQSRTRS